MPATWKGSVMPRATDLTPEHRFFALFVGQSKHGKTVAELSFPGHIHVMDFDGRIRGGVLGSPWLDHSKTTYDYYQPKKPDMIQDLNKKLDSVMAASVSNQPIPTTWITDSITTLCSAFIHQAIPITHPGKVGEKGRWYGPIAAPGPEDYQLEHQACNDYIGVLKTLPIPNVIVSAHLVDKFGKPRDNKGNELTYADSIVIGEKLSIRDKIGVNIQIHFDHVFKFEKETINGEEKFFVTFRGGIASTAYSQLPSGRHDITGKNFYEFMMSFLRQPSSDQQSKP